MAVDKLVDSAQLNADLTSVANAIRTKGGTSAQLAFPSGFVSAVQAIPTGGGGSPTINDYVQNGLIHMWDAEQNTSSGHDDTATVWEDLVGNTDLTRYSAGIGSASWWGAKYLYFSGNANQRLDNADGAIDASVPATVEIALSPLKNAAGMIAGYFGRPARGLGFFSDNTITFRLVQGSNTNVKTYSTGVSAFSDIQTAACVYNASAATGTVYVNNSACVLSANSHYFSVGSPLDGIRVGCGNGSNTYPFTGLIYSIRVYNRALTAEELTKNYHVDLARFFTDYSTIAQVLLGGV